MGQTAPKANSRKSGEDEEKQEIHATTTYTTIDMIDAEFDEEAWYAKLPKTLQDSSRMSIQSQRRMSVSEGLKRSLHKQGTSIHENMVKIHTDRDIRRDFDGFENLTEANVLGQGSWGTVLKIRRREDGRKFACKVLKLSHNIKPERLHELRREISLLSKLDHSHIVKLKYTYEDDGLYLYLVMELLSGHELFERLEDNEKYSEAKARNVLKQMVGSIAYLHSKGIVHRDLKLENFIYRKEKTEDIVLIDFGLSCRFKEGLANGLQQVVGSSYYMAPEVQDRDYNAKCDMWSLGVITYMLLSGTPPFGGSTDREILKKGYAGRYSMPRHTVWDRITAKGKDFINKLLVKDVDKRMSAEEALKHPWLADDNQDMLDSALPKRVVDSLKKFATTERFKRVALQAVAFSAQYEDIEDLHRLFNEIDTDNDGFLTLQDLENALMRREGIDKKTVQEIFHAMDIDRQGKIHLTEFVAAAMTENHIRDENLLLQAFQRLDIDESGEINREDIKKLMGEQLSEDELNDILKNKPTITKKDFVRRMGLRRIDRTRSQLSAFSRTSE